MLFKSKAIGSQPVLDTESGPNKEEACQLLQKIKDNGAMTKKTSKKSVLLSVVIAFFVVITVSSFLSFLDKNIPNNFFVKTEEVERKINEKSITEIINQGYIGKIEKKDKIGLWFRKLFGIRIAQAQDIKDYQTFKIIQSHKSINIAPGKGITFEVGFKNTGNKTWSQDNVFLAAKDSSKEFRHDFWRSSNIPAKLKEAEIKPGHIGYFRFALNAPQKEGYYQPHFILVDKNFRWVSGGDLIIPIKVGNPGKSFEAKKAAQQTEEPIEFEPSDKSKEADYDFDSQGPFIKVGIYHTTNPIKISAVHDFEVRDGKTDNLLAGLSAGQMATVTFNFNLKKYYLMAAGINEKSSNYLKFVPKKGETIWEIVNYENRPLWNLNLNDNKFRGNLEIRYNDYKKRLWLINEIYMEDYLKGLAETSSPDNMEYLKAMTTAGRTYAFYHYNKGTKHAAEYFTVDSVYDQVYRGFGLEKRHPRLVEAVESTKGDIITYDGEPIVAAYFSRSDGRTRDWSEVWGGDVPYAVSVPCPYSEGQDLWGHGVGIDAYDARRSAEDGTQYKDLLKYYYTDVEIEKFY